MITETPSKQAQERISALLDSECTDAEFDLVVDTMLSASTSTGTNAQADHERAAWNVYHQIGDVLRSEDLAITMSADFSSRLSQRLAAEPVVLAPKNREQPVAQTGDVEAHLSAASGAVISPMVAVAANPARVLAPAASRSWAWGMAAAVALAFAVVPQLSSLFVNDSISDSPSAASMAKMDNQPRNVSGANAQLVTDGDVANPSQQLSTGEVEMLRDRRLDSYLMAHQKFSPSIGGGSRYITQASVDVVSPASVTSENK